MCYLMMQPSCSCTCNLLLYISSKEAIFALNYLTCMTICTYTTLLFTLLYFFFIFYNILEAFFSYVEIYQSIVYIFNL